MRRNALGALALAGVLAALAAGCGGGGSSGGGGGETAAPPADTGQPADTGATGGGGGGEPFTLRIGISAALSGPYAAYDQPLVNGMEMAAKQIQEQGGIDGITVEIDVKDNKGDQTLAATTTQELLDDGIKVFVLTTADPSVAQAQLISAAGGIASDGGNTAPAIVSDGGPRVVSFVFGDNGQASAGAEYACEQGYKTAYLIGSPEIPYTKNIPTYFEDAFAKDCGGTIVGEDTYKIGQTEFGSQVTKIQNASPKPDVIYSPIFVPDSGAFLKQLRAAGIDTPFLSTDGNDTSLFADSGGSAVDGAVYTTHGFPSPGSAMEQFIEDYTRIMGKKPESNTFEAIGRDNVYAWVEAAKMAGSDDPDALLAAALQLQDVPLITGSMTMDPDTRIPVKEVTLVKMEGTTFTFLKTITPKYIAPA
jgi:branched-chain amino acid transport system substrate-binding protein